MHQSLVKISWQFWGMSTYGWYHDPDSDWGRKIRDRGDRLVALTWTNFNNDGSRFICLGRAGMMEWFRIGTRGLLLVLGSRCGGILAV